MQRLNSSPIMRGHHTLRSVNGFSAPVAYSVQGLPPAATGAFNGSFLTVTISTATSAGTFSLTIIGTSGMLTHPASVQLTVIAGPKASATSTSLDVAVSGKAVPGTHTLRVTGTSGALSQSIPLTLTVK